MLDADQTLVSSLPSASPAPVAPATPLHADAEWVARARKALTFAGRALDENAPSGADYLMAQELLRRAIECLGAALADGRPVGFAGALDLAEAQLDLERAARGVIATDRHRGRKLLASLADPDTAAPSSARKATFAELELLVGKMVERAEGTRRIVRATWVRRVGLVLLLACAVGAVAYHTLSRPWLDYTFRTSSTYTGFKRTGRLGEAGARELLLHTDEQIAPWVEIDLKETRDVAEVVVRNRTSCCSERGVPLVVELATNPNAWKEVARRTEKFDSWTATFPEQPARWIRLRATTKTILHLREIEIR